MRLGFEEPLEQAMSLPEEERIYVAETLLSSVKPSGEMPPDPDPEWMAAWVTECKRRVAQVDAGIDKTYSWEEVRELARRLLGEHPSG